MQNICVLASLWVGLALRGDSYRHLVQNFYGAHRDCCGHSCSAHLWRNITIFVGMQKVSL